MRRFLALALMAAGFCSAQPVLDNPDGAIGGAVRSTKTGEPLKSVQVSLELAAESQTSSLRATTGPAGEFLFSGLPAGKYFLRFRKTGYRKVPARAHVISLAADGKIQGLNFGLAPAAVITGRVADFDGEPVPDTLVRAYSLHHRGESVLLSPAARAQADDLGEYRLYNLAGGKYIVSVSAPRPGTPAGEFYAGVADVYYPNAVFLSQSTPLRVRWGQELADIDLELQDEPTYWVAGAVFDGATGDGCFDCTMRIARLDGGLIQTLPKQGQVFADGAFLVRGLSAGTYKLSVRQAGDRRVVGQRVVQVTDRNLDNVVLIAGLGRAVSGKIVFEERVGEGPGGGIDVSLFALSAAAWPIPKANTKKDSTFLLEAVPAETYRLAVQPLPPGTYLKALRVGGQRLPRPELTVPEDSPLAGVQVVLAFDAATVTGQVRPRQSSSREEGSVEARVALVPKPSQGGYATAKEVEATPDGSFSFYSVVPGAYTLYALPSMSAAQVMDPAVQSALRPYERAVDLEPEESVTVELRLAPDPEGLL